MDLAEAEHEPVSPAVGEVTVGAHRAPGPNPRAGCLLLVTLGAEGGARALEQVGPGRLVRLVAGQALDGCDRAVEPAEAGGGVGGRFAVVTLQAVGLTWGPQDLDRALAVAALAVAVGERRVADDLDPVGRAQLAALGARTARAGRA